MKAKTPIYRAGLTAALVAVLAAAVPAADGVFHFALQRSVPAADATVAPPEAIGLWYTQAPQDGTLTVRLVNAGGELVETEAPEAAQSDPKAITVGLEAPLADGRYTVTWRGAGDDGHVVSGDFAFTVAAAAASFGTAGAR